MPRSSEESVSYPLFGVPPTTKGEVLFHWLGSHQKTQCGESRLLGQRSLRISGRPIDFGGYVEGLVLSHAFARLMAAAKSIFPGVPIDDAIPKMRTYINSWFYWLARDEINLLVRRTKEAWESTDKAIPSGVAKEIWDSKYRHQCYLCGIEITLSSSGNYYEDSLGERAELEHLWPSSYGGDSVADNLLPSCKRCNKSKGSLISWESGHIHELMYPIDFQSHDFYIRTPRWQKILLHRRAGFLVARRERFNLKRAFQTLGPYSDLLAIDRTDTWDFFNMENHFSNVREHLWQPR